MRHKFLLSLIPAALLLLHPELKTAVADAPRFARFIVDIDGSATATINGQPITLPDDFTVRFGEAVTADGFQAFSIYSDVGYNGHEPIWVGGLIPPAEWCAWNCPLGVGFFGGIRDETGLIEFYPVDQVIDGYSLDLLRGAPVFVQPAAGAWRAVDVGLPDLFTFVDAFFEQTPVADFNANGIVSVQDLFDFLAARGNI